MPLGAESSCRSVVIGEVDTLEIFLSNRCNLDCSYCFVQVHEGSPAYLDESTLTRSIDYFYKFSTAPQKAVNILGGEPLADFALLRRIVEHARRESAAAVIDVTTNGTLLTPEAFRVLTQLGARITVSLDGLKETNDRYRVFHGREELSVHDAVTKRLADLPTRQLGASLVFTSETVDRLFANLYYLSRLGFGRINFQPEFYELWGEDRLAIFERQMELFVGHYISLFRQGDPFVIPMLITLLNPKRQTPDWWKNCHSLVLGPEGGFHSCNRATSLLQKDRVAATIGDARAGVPWEERARVHQDATALLARTLGGDESYEFCPMGMVFSGKLGDDPERGMRNFQAVSRVFAEGLRAIASLLRGNAAFAALYGGARA